MADGSAPVVATERTFAEVLLGELHPSPTQPRRSLVLVREDPAALAAYVKHIADTIEADAAGEPVGQGVREPLRVRRLVDGFEVVDGECRFHAARLKGLVRVCCEIVVLSDEQVIEEQLVANGARLDLTPLEEAEAFAALRALHLDDTTIAERLGRTVRLVRQRLALHDSLVDEGKALLAAGEISAPLAVTLCTLSPDAQREVVAEVRRRSDGGTEALAVREIAWEIKSKRRRLVDGGFPLSDAALVPAAGACTTCPKRSGMQAVLFADGLDDADICADAACFDGKRAARTVQIKAAAKERGLAVVDKPAEVKKLFPYGDQLAHDSAFIDLDKKCDLVRPPMEAPPKNEGRSGGGSDQRCTSEPNGTHVYGMHLVREDNEDDEDDRPAAKAGCESWEECDCGAWREANPPSFYRTTPRGWTAPTWREVLGKALAQVSPTETVKPSLVAEDGRGGVHELADKKRVVKLLEAAKLVDPREAKNEIRQTTPPKKPGELDKFELERKAQAAAEDAAVGAIVAKAVKKAPDAKFWRFLAGLVLHAIHTDVDDAMKRRDIEAEKGDGFEALLKWVADQKEEGALRGLVVELLIGDYAFNGADDSGNVAARFYGVDVDALRAEAKTQIKAEAKEKAKTAAAKASKKTAKASRRRSPRRRRRRCPRPGSGPARGSPHSPRSSRRPSSKRNRSSATRRAG